MGLSSVTMECAMTTQTQTKPTMSAFREGVSKETLWVGEGQVKVPQLFSLITQMPEALASLNPVQGASGVPLESESSPCSPPPVSL